MGEKERNQKHKNRKEAKESDEERKDKRKSLCFLQAFLPFFPSLLFSSLRCFAFWKNFLQTQEEKKQNKTTTTTTTTLVLVPPSLSQTGGEKKQRNNSGNKQTLCTRRHAERQIPTPQTTRKRGKAEGASAPFCAQNTIITRRLGGPLRAWVAGSIITRNTDSIITRSWDSIITPKGFRKIILA
jgi:hypothetical protein